MLGTLAGKSSHFVLSKLGRGSTLPGKLALKFDNDILNTLARDYEVVVITGTNGKTLTTALTVGILWRSCDQSQRSQYDYGDYHNFPDH